MYWSRSGSVFDLVVWLLQGLVWAAGGWLIARHAFPLRPKERLSVGIALGFVLFITFANLAALFLALETATWAAAALVLGLGAWSAFTRRLKLNLAELAAWPELAALAALTLLFTWIGAGLALFDDYLHLPLVSIMAAGRIPPPFYLDPSQPMAYHYALQMFAAAAMRAGGMFPWSAWDLAKGFAIALTLVLGWVWLKRATRDPRAAWLGTILLTFGGGARWVLLLAPQGWLKWMSSAVTLAPTAAASGSDLANVLAQPWRIEGGAAVAFPFAYHNGIFVPVMFVLGSSGALPYLTAILLLILTRQRKLRAPAILSLGLVFASLALSGEHLFVLLWAGIALAMVVSLARNRARRRPVDRKYLLAWAAILLLSGILSVTQGGYLTEVMRSLVLRLQGTATSQGPYNFFFFTLRWPPGLTSGHLGELSFLNPRQLVVLLAELGPVLLLGVPASWWAWKGLQRGDWLVAGLGIAGLVSFLLPTFFRYGFERSATRLPATALWIWMLLGFPAAWQVAMQGKPAMRALLKIGYGVTLLGGLVIFAIQITAIPQQQLSYYIEKLDARMARTWWDRLPADAQVIDKVASRSVTVFGRPMWAYRDVYEPYPEWEALIANPDPSLLARAGYDYVYLDRSWWRKLTAEQKRNLESPCVKALAEEDDAQGDFRRLLEISKCR
jgi:hypothetical protein